MKKFRFKDGFECVAATAEEAKAKHKSMTSVNRVLVETLKKNKDMRIKFTKMACPICGSKDIEMEDISTSNLKTAVSRKAIKCYCLDCNSEWRAHCTIQFSLIDKIRYYKSNINEMIKDEDSEKENKELKDLPKAKKLPITKEFKITSMEDTTPKRRLVYETLFYNKGKAKEVALTVKYKGKVETFKIDADKIQVKKQERHKWNGVVSNDIAGKTPGFREWAEKTFNVPKFGMVWDYVVKIVIK